MENKDISQIALQKIKESGIKPISKNVFNLKRALFWLFVCLSLFVGIISFAISLSILFDNDWYLYNKFGFNFIFKTLPYFWFVCLAIFTILGDFYYRKTTFGYRHRTVAIVLVYIILTVVFGTILHIVGLGNKFEKSISNNVPGYHGLMFDRDEFWSHPEGGLLYGRIIGVNGNSIQIIDFNDNLWTLNTENAFVGGRVKIETGEVIKIIGNIDDGNIFTVEQIRPCMNIKHNNSMCSNMMR